MNLLKKKIKQNGDMSSSLALGNLI